MRLVFHLAIVLLGLVLRPVPGWTQSRCPRAVDSLVEHGWTSYRAGALDAAEQTFRRALARCPRHLGALMGRAYVHLQQGRLAQARAGFEIALRQDSTAADAIFGLGVIAWREGNEQAARAHFLRVVRFVPGHREAMEYLGRLGTPPRRPRLMLPDTVVHLARTRGDGFEVFQGGAWQPYYVKGVNLGAALPGKFPNEFPDSATYAAWIAQIGAMGANTIRVYTIHPPYFYEAFAEYNRAHPARPIRLIHGVWTELPPSYDFDDPVWNREFAAEVGRVVDLVHGRADLPRRPGHASGFYTADVSDWTLAYIIGREWEPFAVAAYDTLHPGPGDWSGRYLAVTGGTAMDVWLARVCDSLVAYETDTYRTQRPVAYTSWPTLDPLYHPTEASVAEDVAMRGGYPEDVATEQHDDDVASVDPSRVRATPEFRGGFFAAYHAYPYYPDFIVLEGGYADYLRRLKAHHRDMPVVIAEYGVPASLGIAHLAPEGWHHGGHSDTRMAAINAELTKVIAASGMAGGIYFAWIDEWFKKNWLVIDLELPPERNRLWLSRMNPEEQYGVLAMEPEPRLPGATLTERLPAWRALTPLYGGALRALADEAYLWLLVESGPRSHADSVFIGLDVVDPSAGAFRWPQGDGGALPVGVEFVVAASLHDVRVLAAPRADPFQVRRQVPFRPPLQTLEIANPPPGLFRGPYDQVYRSPLGGGHTTTGQFETLQVVTNRTRLGRDGVERAAMGYERGFLPHGPAPDGFWELDSASGVLEIRVPWSLINVADPSSRQALSSPAGQSSGFSRVPVDGIRLLLAARQADDPWRQWPQAGTAAGAEIFTWPTWEKPRWRARRRPVFEALRDAFLTLEPAGR